MAQQHINYDVPSSGNGDTLRTSQVKAESNFNELYANKVDKVAGKELSDNNFSDEDKAKLDTLDPDGNVQSDWDEGDSGNPAFILNKPTNTSEFFNDGDGLQSFVTDTGAAGVFARSQGEWINLSTFGSITQEQFVWDSGSQTFMLANNYGSVISVVVQGVSLKNTQYTLTSPNSITINDTLNIGNYVIIIYSAENTIFYDPELVANTTKFAEVESYELMTLIIPSPYMTIVKVLNDENKGIQNTVYHIYPDGVRMWIAANPDN